MKVDLLCFDNMSENESLNIKPEVNSDVIHDIIWRNYNFQVLEIQKLNGYEDLNFKIRTLDKGDKDGCSEAQDREYVLKIINRTGTECRKIVGKIFSRPLALI